MKKNGQKAKSAWCKKAVEAIQKNYRSVLVILGFFLLWEFSVVWFKVPEFVLPPPSAALKHLFIKQADANYNWPLHIRTTLQEFILIEAPVHKTSRCELQLAASYQDDSPRVHSGILRDGGAWNRAGNHLCLVEKS